MVREKSSPTKLSIMPAAGDTPSRFYHSPRLQMKRSPIGSAEKLTPLSIGRLKNSPIVQLRKSPRTSTPLLHMRVPVFDMTLSTIASQELELINLKRMDDGRDYSIPRAAFERVAKELSGGNVKWTGDAVEALQAGAEDVLIDIFTSMAMMAELEKKKTILPRHFYATRFVMKI